MQTAAAERCDRWSPLVLYFSPFFYFVSSDAASTHSFASILMQAFFSKLSIAPKEFSP